MTKKYRNTRVVYEDNSMDKVKTALINAGLGLILLLAFVLTGYNETHYSMTGTVVTTSYNGEVCIEDTTGNLWEVLETDYCRGDKVRMMFFTDGTDTTRKDDTIVKVKKIR